MRALDVVLRRKLLQVRGGDVSDADIDPLAELPRRLPLPAAELARLRIAFNGYHDAIDGWQSRDLAMSYWSRDPENGALGAWYFHDPQRYDSFAYTDPPDPATRERRRYAVRCTQEADAGTDTPRPPAASTATDSAPAEAR